MAERILVMAVQLVPNMLKTAGSAECSQADSSPAARCKEAGNSVDRLVDSCPADHTASPRVAIE